MANKTMGKSQASSWWAQRHKILARITESEPTRQRKIKTRKVKAKIKPKRIVKVMKVAKTKKVAMTKKAAKPKKTMSKKAKKSK